MLQNRARVRIYEAPDMAKAMRRTFTAKEVRERKEMPFSWPSRLQHVGDSVGVAYASDKWKHDGDFEIYKHIAESRNRALCKKGLLYRYDDRQEPWPTIGPLVSFENDVAMPRDYAVLAYFEEANFCLHSEGTDDDPLFADEAKDDCYVKVLIPHGILGGSKIRWSAVDPKRGDQPFLFVYTEPRGSDPGGVHLIIVGDELDIEKDGIVG